MKRILCVLLLLLIPLTCHAHKAMGYMPERTKACIELVNNHLKTKYNLSLQKEVTVYVTKTTKEYQWILEANHFPDAKELAITTQGITSEGCAILINGEMMPDKHFCFVLAHEMVHQYQFENYPKPFSDHVMVEGKADVIAAEISQYDIDIRDHGIPYENLKTREQFFKLHKERGHAVLEQVRYYAQKNPEFIPK
jgi:hypothetical protein